MRRLREHDWPGNVRELQNYVERAVILGTGPRADRRAPAAPAPRRVGPPADPPPRRRRRLRLADRRAGPPGHPRRRPGRQRPARPDRRPGRARADPAGAPDLRPRPDQGRRPPGHQPQHPAQEALRVPHRRDRRPAGRIRMRQRRRRPGESPLPATTSEPHARAKSDIPIDGGSTASCHAHARCAAGTTLEFDRLYPGDCLELFPRVAAGSIDLVFADPPFNIGYDYDIYDDRREAEAYLDWTQVLGPRGRSCPQARRHVLAGDRRRVRRRAEGPLPSRAGAVACGAG